MGEVSDPKSLGRADAVDSKARGRTQAIELGEPGFATTKLDDLLNWARKYSLFQYPFATACCAMEYMAAMSPRFDLGRFGAEAPRFSPRQSDVLWVVGTVSQRQAPILRRVWQQMAEPRWVVAFGTCASTGGFYDNYATLAGIDLVVPVDVYVPGCPPRPEGVLDALLLLQDKIASGDPRPRMVKPRLDPVAKVRQLADRARSPRPAVPGAGPPSGTEEPSP
jgi:NADH-quinone oxidoreductase subunit B